MKVVDARPDSLETSGFNSQWFPVLILEEKRREECVDSANATSLKLPRHFRYRMMFLARTAHMEMLSMANEYTAILQPQIGINLFILSFSLSFSPHSPSLSGKALLHKIPLGDTSAGLLWELNKNLAILTEKHYSVGLHARWVLTTEEATWNR